MPDIRQLAEDLETAAMERTAAALELARWASIWYGAGAPQITRPYSTFERFDKAEADLQNALDNWTSAMATYPL